MVTMKKAEMKKAAPRNHLINKKRILGTSFKYLNVFLDLGITA